MTPWIPNSRPRESRNLGCNLVPLWKLKVLGADSWNMSNAVGAGNASIVHRSAAQNPELYGDVFHYEEYFPATGI
ncbi:hypothetical protein BDV09DRAFT_196026 [Aspergillus tetrazonus]